MEVANPFIFSVPTLLVIMNNKNKRRFSRMDILWTVHLYFGLKEYTSFIEDLSLSGLYIEGNFNQSINDLCIIHLKQSLLYKNPAISAVGSVSRISEAGIAIEFISMKLDSFSCLQSALLNYSFHPSIVSREFRLNNFFELDDDLVFYNHNKLIQRQIKQLASFL